MRFLLICLVVFINLESRGQPTAQKILSLLEGKRLSSFNKSVRDSMSAHVFERGPEGFSAREIIPDFSETVVEVLSNRTDLVPCRINLLSKDDVIFFYEIRNISGDSIIEQYKNVTVFDQFEGKFEYVYGAPIDTADLFLTDIRYGHHCGLAGRNPEPCEQMINFVDHRDILSLRRWLRSANAEKQLYGARGISLLAQTGYLLTTDDLRIFRILQEKKGNVNTCSGCTYWGDATADVATEIIENYPKYEWGSENFSPKPLHLPVTAGIIISIIIFFSVGYLLKRSKKTYKIFSRLRKS
jgi:hypothetical protein